ncbi:HET domain-containing protein, partial [Candidatus Bathyarchaeota archaeon]|nr:HET domain-containing protein [Candidatus Bathyarchaeota archaeon]
MAPGPEPSLYGSADLQLGPGQIRLLSLSPPTSPTRDGPIQCTLSVVDLSLSHPPPYHALSYTWGPPAEHGPLGTMTDRPDHPILCNAHPLPVTQNLHGALQHLAHVPWLAG